MVLQCLLQAVWQRLLFPCPEGQVGELGEAIDVRGGGRPLLVPASSSGAAGEQPPVVRGARARSCVGGGCWRLPMSPSDDARRRQFGTAVFHEPRIDLQAHRILL